MKLENFVYYENMAVNLAEVSTIKITESRILFNFKCTVKKFGNTIPDSFSVDNYTENDLKFTETEYFKDNFIKCSETRYLNKNCISSMRYNASKGVIIFNLNHLHTYNRTFDENGVSLSEKVDMAEYVYMTATHDEYLTMLGVK